VALAGARGRQWTGRAALLLIALSVLGGCTQATSLENRLPRLISVRGTGRVAVKPDTAVVRIGAEMRAPTLAEATADVARRSSAVIDRVKSLGVAERDISTVTYSIDPMTAPRRTDEDPTRIVAYRVVNVVQVKIRDLSAVGRVLDGALSAGANTMSGLQFTMDDPSKPEAEARALAVKAAASTARQLAAAAGVGLGDLMSLTEGPPSRPVMPRMAAESLMAAAPMSAGPVESGQIEIVVSVEAQYRIGP
jgi:uncharacterized protein YggE